MPKPKSVAFISLGCAKNLVDSEKMLGQLAQAGCVLTDDESQADVIVINTCGFLEAARAEAIGEIEAAVAKKTSSSVQRVVVAGCLVQRDKEGLLDRVEGIDAMVGVNNRDDIVRAVIGPTKPGAPPSLYLGDYHPLIQLDTARLRITPRHYAYLRISEGCNQKCTFCTIPLIRGPMHSKPLSLILDEARELVADGVVEINLIGQDTTSYGRDIGYEQGLAGLLHQLNEVDGLKWIRLMYAYPSVLTDEMIDAIASCRKVCNYVDIPLQHISDRVLKAMGRRIDRRQTENLLARLRRRIPDVTIRTTLIAGFPGETRAEFAELVEFVKDFRFDALGVFSYSREPETPAAGMKAQLPDDVKQERVETLMIAQQEVAFWLAKERIGRRFDVLVDVRTDDNAVVARHEGQAPQVDSVTLLANCSASPGDFISVRGIASRDYDVVASEVQAVSAHVQTAQQNVGQAFRQTVD